MSENCQIVLTIMGTVFSGVLVFVISQLIIEKYVKPYDEYKALKGKVAFILIMYANLYCNPIEPLDEPQSFYQMERINAATDTRKTAAEVSAFKERVGRGMPGIPSKETLQVVSEELIRLSNAYTSTEPYKIGEYNKSTAAKIKRLMSIEE